MKKDININYELNKLLQYGLNKKLITDFDYYYSVNRLLALLHVSSFLKQEVEKDINFYDTINNILDFAYENKVIKSNGINTRDILDSKIMDCLMLRPSELNKNFWSNYQTNPTDATKYFYKLCKNSNYIRNDRISRNLSWKTKTKYGEINITINLSKPEKDPHEIALVKNTLVYPKCLLCRENEGFRGHPGRSNHRIIKIELNKEKWFLQYSPYVYYNEHCIVLKENHDPMKIDKNTFTRLLDFVSLFPHYFLGSNADLPIVGGSILNHDHYQGGHYKFPMAKAQIKENIKFRCYKDVDVGILDWPMSVIRLSSNNKQLLIELADLILTKWRNYSDEVNNILCQSEGVPHNTITPIARINQDKYEMDLVLRNNRTTKNYPLGIFHPHQEHHHLKKENIGLIEVMGLAVLPKRLKKELQLVKDYILHDKDILSNDEIKKHFDWINNLKNKYQINKDNIDQIIQNEVGYKFVEILTQCAVFKNNDTGLVAFKNFLNSVCE